MVAVRYGPRGSDTGKVTVWVRVAAGQSDTQASVNSPTFEALWCWARCPVGVTRITLGSGK